ncbi:MAG: hypothetical protein AUG51_09670 [Acidobacteria bacterium 13_1_20CM_3_53_8]|nr:MAG: hypothetical protein AUG51_09670 [Acidobacteria bacterium 13_1_20CM_3_53_8]
MTVRYIKLAAVCAVLILGLLSIVSAQQQRAQQSQSQGSEATPMQRIEIMRSRLNAMRRSLDSAIATLNAQDSGQQQQRSNQQRSASDDPRERLRGLEKEVGSVLSEVNDIGGKVERSERFDHSRLDQLETSVTDLNTRVDAALVATAGARSAAASNSTASATPQKKKKKGRFFGLLGGGGGDDRYSDLTGTAAPGRDRELFETATREVRRGRYEQGRLLYQTIVTTYPDSPFLPLAKLAIADSFYLEGTTSALIQATAAYQDWLTFFPTDPLADRVMLKMAEADMRQMGLADRDISRARKAEQRLKALLQQFPQTQLRPSVMEHLYQVQESLGMHNLQVARFYVGRQEHGHGGLKGAQDRLREILQKYPNFSYMDEVLMRLGTLYMEEEEPDEAAKYFQQLVRDYPSSEYLQKAREQLQLIGAQIPEPDPIRRQMPVPQRPGTMENLYRQITGIADVDVDKNGVIISHDSHATDDLIDLALRNNGQLPSNIATPVRTAPYRPVVPQQQQNQQPANDQQRTGGTSIRVGSQQGPVPSSLNPSVTPPPPTVPQTRPQPQQTPPTSTVVPAPSPTPSSTPPGS